MSVKLYMLFRQQSIQTNFLQNWHLRKRSLRRLLNYFSKKTLHICEVCDFLTISINRFIICDTRKILGELREVIRVVSFFPRILLDDRQHQPVPHSVQLILLSFKVTVMQSAHLRTLLMYGLRNNAFAPQSHLLAITGKVRSYLKRNSAKWRAVHHWTR